MIRKKIHLAIVTGMLALSTSAWAQPAGNSVYLNAYGGDDQHLYTETFPNGSDIFHTVTGSVTQLVLHTQNSNTVNIGHVTLDWDEVSGDPVGLKFIIGNHLWDGGDEGWVDNGWDDDGCFNFGGLSFTTDTPGDRALRRLTMLEGWIGGWNEYGYRGELLGDIDVGAVSHLHVRGRLRANIRTYGNPTDGGGNPVRMKMWVERGNGELGGNPPSDALYEIRALEQDIAYVRMTKAQDDWATSVIAEQGEIANPENSYRSGVLVEHGESFLYAGTIQAGGLLDRVYVASKEIGWSDGETNYPVTIIGTDVEGDNQPGIRNIEARGIVANITVNGTDASGRHLTYVQTDHGGGIGNFYGTINAGTLGHPSGSYGGVQGDLH